MDWQTKMNQVLDYIEENITGEIKPEAAAKRAGYSVWEFQRLFSFVAHTSLGEYIRGRKLDTAVQDILKSDAKIIDIAVKYGYESHAAFSRAFGKQYGVSPTSAREAGVPLAPYPKITFLQNSEERNDGMKTKNDMQTYSERGYYVKENAPLYLTPDMEKTSAWFRDILGWYGGIVDESGGDYGCVFDYPGELMASGLTPFRGIHLFKGEPSKDVVGFILVKGLERFRQFVLANGWDQITEIEKQPWGANECRVTTIDGSVLRFFENLD
ncbi:MAG: helix-turn-helix domain-containing protein [Defluviitaleaceae bacterium]|nr:helix-turn-helix domain-containing protein [Defluviitaleaceae bacterium]